MARDIGSPSVFNGERYTRSGGAVDDVAGVLVAVESDSTSPDATNHRVKSQGEIEAAVCEGMARFLQTFLGRGPKSIHSHLIADLVVIRVDGVLTAAEQHLFVMLEPQKGRDLFKGLRTQLVESSRARLDTVIEAACEVPVVSMHHDISTVTGEEIFVFRLTESPVMRAPRKK
jgi:uncharacterized protein YbcI